MKKILRITVCVLLALCIGLYCGLSVGAGDEEKVNVVVYEEPITNETEPELKIEEPEKVFQVELITTFVDENLNSYTMEELDELIQKYDEDRLQAIQLIKSAKALNWPQDCETIINARIEHKNALVALKVYQDRQIELAEELEEAKWADKAEEYPAATYIWRYMKDLGWNDYVCAGVMGNIMAEVGGGSLYIQYWLAGGNGWFYGMCQWSKYYCPEVYGLELPEQCDYLRDTVEYQINTYGFLYYSGFNYEKFLNLTNEKDAAYAFGICYERPASEYLNIRCTYATRAYNYFVDE